MKNLLLLLFIIPNVVFAQCLQGPNGNCPPETPSVNVEVLPMPPIDDLSDSVAVSEGLIKAYRERAIRENYWGDVDEAAGYPRRFGPKKDEDYYVILYYQAQARENAERLANLQSGKVDQMLNDALAKEAEIRQHYGYAKDTIKDFEKQINYWKGQAISKDARLNSCKKSRGRKC